MKDTTLMLQCEDAGSPCGVLACLPDNVPIATLRCNALNMKVVLEDVLEGPSLESTTSFLPLMSQKEK